MRWRASSAPRIILGSGKTRGQKTNAAERTMRRRKALRSQTSLSSPCYLIHSNDMMRLGTATAQRHLFRGHQ